MPYYVVNPYEKSLYSGDGRIVTYTYNQVKILDPLEKVPYYVIKPNRKALYNGDGKVITYVDQAKMLDYLEIEPIKLVTENIEAIIKTKGEKLLSIQLPFTELTRVDLVLDKKVVVPEIQQDNDQSDCCLML